MARRIPSWLKPPLRAIKRAALGARRLVARQLLAPFAAKAPASKDDRKAPLRFRAAFALYFAKRLLQERYARGWPRRARFAAFKLEMQSAFVIKLQQWADFPLGWAPDPYAAQRRNQTLFPAEAERQRALAAAWERKPTFTVLVPVWNAKREWLDRLIGSVLGQTYAEWTLLLVDDCSTLPETAASLSEWAARDSRITVHRRDKNGGVTAASNDGLSLASGEFVAFADHDDELLPDALWEMASAIRNNPGVDLLYSDEEYVPPNGAPYPAFKPGWSPELLTAYNYICHLLVVRRARIEEIRGFRTGTEGAQDFDLILRLMPRLRKVVHVPRVLYRWHLVEESISRGKARDGEVTARTSLDETTRKVVQDHFERLGIAARIDIVGGWARPSYVVKQWPAVAVIICSRDNPVLLDLAMESLVPVWETVNWTNRHGMEKDDAFALALAERNIKLILVDNGSTTPEAQAFYERHRRNFVVLRIDNGPEGFNWSALNNAAARLPEVEHLLFLNDDIEANPKIDWYQELVGAMAHKGVGVAGALLKYPDGKIQHAGVICGAHGWGPWHVLMGARIDDPNAYQGMVHFPRNVAAVTGACLMTRADVFRKLGGFDERRLKVGFSDIDYCHRVRKLGYRIAYVPQAELIHKEGQSRGKRIDAKEAAVLAARQRGIVDPYWNPHFTRETHIPTVCSRRKARRLCHPNGPHVLFIGEETLPGSIGPKWEKLAFEWTGKGKASKYFLDDDEAGLAHAIAALDPDAVFANGTAGVAAVELAAAAGIP
ncbi:MAG TPA: glycosyltransferase, partial [Planctomycetia bacterium]|nr:glycosyltransferase [Planctomycetia bacterium]